MAASFDNTISVTTSLDAPAVTAEGFGRLLIAATGLGGGFTERSRIYATAAEAAADADLSAAALAALTDAFAQEPRVDEIVVGRIGADVAQLVTWTFSGTIEVGDELEISVDDETATHVANSTTLNDEVGDLRTALDALLGAAYTVGGAGAVITVTAAVAGTPFDYDSSATPVAAGDIAVAEVETTPNKSIGTELDAILADYADWYGLCQLSRTALQLSRMADWAEVNGKLALLQTSDAAVITSATDDIASTLQDLALERSVILWHETNTEYADAAWLALKLSADPDQETTVWYDATLQSITPDTKMTTAQMAFLLAKNANVYSTLKGVGATGPGKTCDGNWIDLRITADWVTARMVEAIATLRLRESNANRKIPYTPAGVAQLESVLEPILARGVSKGHFSAGTTRLVVPNFEDISLEDLDAREVTLAWEAAPAGAIRGVTITGVISNVFA